MCEQLTTFQYDDLLLDARRGLDASAYACRGLGVFVHVSVNIAWRPQHRRKSSGEL